MAGVCSSRNEEFVRAWRCRYRHPTPRLAVQQIPNHLPDWAHSFDLIFDCVGIDEYFTDLAPWLLKPNGRFVTAALPSFHPAAPEKTSARSKASP